MNLKSQFCLYLKTKGIVSFIEFTNLVFFSQFNLVQIKYFDLNTVSVKRTSLHDFLSNRKSFFYFYFKESNRKS